MKRLIVNLIISAVAIATACGAVGCSKGSTMNGETMDRRTEQVRTNESKKGNDMHMWNNEMNDFGDMFCPKCGSKINKSSLLDERCKGKNYKDGACDEDKCKDCEDKNCQDENCPSCKEKEGKKVELPKPRHPKFVPGRGGKLPKKPHRLPPKSISF